MQAPRNALGSILTDLVGDEAERAAYRADPEGFLAKRGFPDFPERVVGEAVCHVADTLPASVAEQLAPEVMALSPLTTIESTDDASVKGFEALDALVSVPALGLTDLETDVADEVGVDAHELAGVATSGPDDAVDADPGFGRGLDAATEEAGRDLIDELTDEGDAGPLDGLDHVEKLTSDEGLPLDDFEAVHGETADSAAPVEVVDESAEPADNWDDDVE